MHSTSNLNDGYIGSGTLLAKAIKKHGRENFSIEILEFCDDREKLKLRESQLVTQEVLDDPMCMNLKLGGGYGTFGIKHDKKREYRPLSESHKAALSKSGKGKYGKWKRTPETNSKISETLRSHQQSEDTKRKRSESLRRFWRENPKAERLRKQKEELMNGNTHAKKV
jgi:hypothetical protein